jgi:DnaK suppressor protein
MIDAADRAAANDERAMELFQRKRTMQTGEPPTMEINCVDCGEIIPPARLVAMPRTKRCMPCASEVELR